MRLPLFVFLTLLTLFTSTLLFLPLTPVEAGLIPCGLSTPDPDIPGGGTERCTLCHLLVGISRIVVFLRNIMAAVAVAVLVAMAIIYLTSGGNEGRMTFAKGGMFAALIGLGVVLLAWVTVNFILTLPIINTTTGLIRTGWDTVSCSTTSLSTGAVATTTPTPSTGGGGASGTGGGLGGGGDLVTLPRDATGTPIIAPALPSPTNLTATATATDAITVTWASVPGATGYAIERCTGLTCITFTPLGTLTGTSFIDQGLASGTGYSYHVQAISSAGVSGWTNVVSATTQGVPSNPYVYVPPVDDPYGMAGGGGSGSDGGTNACTIPAGAANPASDPGLWTGTWKPAGASNLYVVDQSWPQSTPASTSYVPDCVNQGVYMTTPDCRDTTTPPVTISNNTIAVRYAASSYTGAASKMFSLRSEIGSGIPTNVSISLSTFPGDFSNSLPAACKSDWPTFSYPYLITGDGGCPFTPGLIYYLNIKSGPCTGNCTYKVNESAHFSSGTSGTHPACTAGGGTNSCSAGAPGDPRTGTWRPSARVTVGDPTGGLVQSNVTYVPGCLNPDPNQTIVTCGQNSSGASMASGDVVSVRYRVGASYTQGEYFQINSGGGSGISFPIDFSLSLTPGDFSPADADCLKSGFQLSTPRIVIGDGAGQCHLMTNSLYYLNTRIRESCSGPGCVFKIAEPLSMQGTTVNCTATGGSGSSSGSGTGTTSGSGSGSGTGTNSTPAFPWTIHGTTYTSLSAVQTAFSPSCVNVNGVTVVHGFGPCVSGTAP